MLQVSGNTALPTEAIKAYLGAIDNFDNLYIIQQGGRGVTREQIINRLKNVLNKGKNKDEIFEVIWKNETFKKMFLGRCQLHILKYKPNRCL